jgi:hypothetical protein
VGVLIKRQKLNHARNGRPLPPFRLRCQAIFIRSASFARASVSALKNFRIALEDHGYLPMDLPAMSGSGDIWYRNKRSSDDAIHVMELGYKPLSKAYSVHVGVYNARAREMIERAMPLLKPFIKPPLVCFDIFFDRKCWQLFDAGRALKWKSTYMIPDPKNRGGWPELVDDLFLNFLNPIFFPINDAMGIRNLLSRQDAPFEWFATPAVLRAAEIIALGIVGNIDEDEIRSHISFFRDDLRDDLPVGKSFDELVDKLLRNF